MIAAGGFANRLGTNRPKSLLNASSEPLLSWVIKNVFAAGISRILIFHNRPEWVSEYETVVGPFSDITLIRDAGVSSTFHLARRASQFCLAKRYLFFYGHAPRPTAHIRRLLSLPSPAATACRTSSRQRPLQINTGSFIEPPFAVSAEALAAAPQAENWGEFFAIHPPSTCRVSGPAEFNFESERLQYNAYVVASLQSHRLCADHMQTPLALWPTRNSAHEAWKSLRRKCLSRSQGDTTILPQL